MTCDRCGARRVDGQIGLESSTQEWCDRLVNVFRELRRVLRRDGTLWVECGDSYDAGTRVDRQTRPQGKDHGYWENGEINRRIRGAGTKPKDQILAPHLLAAALRNDGWYLRSTIIWAKPNPMPESVQDRPTSAHSYVFLLAKSSRYFWDAEAIREDAEYGFRDQKGFAPIDGLIRPRGTVTGGDPSAGRNSRTVWTISTEPNGLAVCANPDCQGYWQREAPRQHCGLPVVQHYAAFPRELVRRCILAGTSEYGCCPECGAPWEREVEREPMVVREGPGRQGLQEASQSATSRTAITGTMLKPASSRSVGWRSSCDHGLEPVPCTVLDPFAGSGTTLLVARQHDRHAIGIDLSEPYARMSRHRLSQQSLLTEGAA